MVVTYVNRAVAHISHRDNIELELNSHPLKTFNVCGIKMYAWNSSQHGGMETLKFVHV